MERSFLFYKRPAIPGRTLPIFNNETENELEVDCCELMDMFLADPRIPVSYSSQYRVMLLPMVWCNVTKKCASRMI